MYIYNTTYLVADACFGTWLKWVAEEHIPFMNQCGFSNPQVAKVLTTESDQEGTSISVQFHIPTKEQIVSWEENEAMTVQNSLMAKFGNNVLAFTTVLKKLF